MGSTRSQTEPEGAAPCCPGSTALWLGVSPRGMSTYHGLGAATLGSPDFHGGLLAENPSGKREPGWGGPCPVGCSGSTGGRTSQPSGRCLGCSGEGASVWVPPPCAGDLPLRDQRGASRDRLRVMVGLLLPDGDSGKLPGAEPCLCGAASAHRPPAWERNRLCRRRSSELPDCTGDLTDGWTLGGTELSA